MSIGVIFSLMVEVLISLSTTYHNDWQAIAILPEVLPISHTCNELANGPFLGPMMLE